MALHTGMPVTASQATVVSRWLVMEMGGDIRRRHPGLGHGLAHGEQRGLQNLHRVVLHKAGLGVDLPEFLLPHAGHAAEGIEQHARELVVPWSMERMYLPTIITNSLPIVA